MLVELKSVLKTKSRDEVEMKVDTERRSRSES